MTTTIQILESSRRDVGLSIAELWFRYFNLGGMGTALELEAFLCGAVMWEAHDRDVPAVALNERYAEQGRDHPLSYTDDPATA